MVEKVFSGRVLARRLVRVSVLLSALWGGFAGADEAQLLAAIDARAEAVKAVSQQIFEFRELGQQEFKSSQLLMDELRKLGFSVQGDLKVPEDLVKGGIAKTAFRAELKGKGPGPTVTVMLEYDALPNGHTCGHNLISGSGLLAAAGLAQVMKDLPGRLVVIGTPDEERGSLGGGKIALLEGKHFEGSDVVLISGGITDIVAEVTALGISAATTDNVKAAGTALGAQVHRLVAAGAKQVVVVGPYNLGLSPWAVGLGQAAGLTDLTNRFNEAFLISVVDLGANVLYVDAALYFNLVHAAPTGYAMVNVTDKACTTPDALTCTASTIVPTIDYTKALFADGVHLTPAAHRLFGLNAYTKVRERW